MAKKIIDNTPIQNFEDPWGGVYESGQDAGKEWGKTHSEVERVIKEKVADIEEELQDNADAIEELETANAAVTTAINQLMQQGGISVMKVVERPDSSTALVGFVSQDDYTAWNALSDAEKWTDGLSYIKDWVTLPSVEQTDIYRVQLILQATPSQTQQDTNVTINVRGTSQLQQAGETGFHDITDTLTLQVQTRTSTSAQWENREIPSLVLEANVNTYSPLLLRPYLYSGYNYVRVRAVSEYAVSSWVTFTVNVVALSLTPNTPFEIPMSGDTLSLNYLVGGTISKTMQFEFGTGRGSSFVAQYSYLSNSYCVKNVGESVNMTTGMTFDFSDSTMVETLMAAGAHTVRARLYVSESIKTDWIESQYYVAGATPCVIINEVNDTLDNWTEVTFLKWSADTAGAATMNVRFLLKSNNNTQTYSSWEFVAESGVEYTFSSQLGVEIDTEGADFYAWLHVVDSEDNELSAPVFLTIGNAAGNTPTAGADLVIVPSLRSNSEATPKTIINNVNGNIIQSTWTGFGMVSDGWIDVPRTSDSSDTIKALHIPAGRSLDINYNPLSDFVSGSLTGKHMTLEIDFRTDNILDENEPILQICSTHQVNGDIYGFEMLPLEAYMLTNNKRDRENQNVSYAEGVRIHLALNIVYGLQAAGMSQSLNYVRMFINGVLDREFTYNVNDTFGTSGLHIVIGNTKSDIDIFGIRCYKKALSTADVMQDYKASLPTVAEKVSFNEDNDILGDNGEISYTKAIAKYNVLGLTGTLAKYGMDNKGASEHNTLLIHIQGDPDHSGTLTELENSGQGTTAMTYYDWNQQQKLTSNTQWIPEGSNVGESVSGYAIQTGEAKAKKLCGKINFASSMQGHKMGLTWAYNDVFKRLVSSGYITEPGQIALQSSARIAVYEKPFLFFHRATVNDPWQFKYLMTWGAGKGDKPTFGFDKNTTPDMLMVEGANNDRPLALFRMPWTDAVTYDPDEESWMYAGQAQLDFGIGKTSVTNNKEYPSSTNGINAMKAFFNFAYLHNTSVKQYDGTLTQLRADNTVSANYLYWTTQADAVQGAAQYDLFRFDDAAGTWIKAGVDGSSTLNIRTQYVEFGGTAAWTQGQWEIINTAFINQRIQHFAANASTYFHVDDALYHSCFVKLFAATDNRAKNTYYYTDPTTLKVRFMQDDLDTTIKTNNVGQNRKPYYVEEHDKDSYNAYYWQGESSGFYNVLESAFATDMKRMMYNIFSAMAQISGTVMNFMESHLFLAQNYFPAIAYNEQARLVYEVAAVAQSNGSYSNDSVQAITQSCGSQRWSEYGWMVDRIMYISSWCEYGEFAGSSSAPNGLSWRGVSANYTFTLTPAKWLYPRIGNDSGNYPASESGAVRVRAGETFTYRTFGLSSDSWLSIRGINYYLDIGDMNVALSASQGSFSISGKRLQKFVVNPNGTDANVMLASGLIVTNAINIKELTIRNVSTASGEFDITKCTRLETINLEGTGFNNVQVPASDKLTTLRLPATLQAITLVAQPSLVDVNFEGTDYLNEVTIDQAMVGSLNTQTLIASLYSSKGLDNPIETLNVYNITWTDILANFLVWCSKSTTSHLTGTITMPVAAQDRYMTLDEILLCVERWGNIQTGGGGLTVNYPKREITSIGVRGDKYIVKPNNNPNWDGTFPFIFDGWSLDALPTTGNDVKIGSDNKPMITYALSSGVSTYADMVDSNKGIISVKQLQNSLSGVPFILTVSLTRYDDSVITVNKNIGFYTRIPKLGDFAYLDGTFDNEYDRTRGIAGAVIDCKIVNTPDDGEREITVIAKSDAVIKDSNGTTWSYHYYGPIQDNGHIPAALITAINSTLGVNVREPVPATSETNNQTASIRNDTTYIDDTTDDGYKVTTNPIFNDFATKDKHTRTVNIATKVITAESWGTDDYPEININMPTTLTELGDAMTAYKAARTAAGDTSVTRWEELFFPAFLSCELYEPAIEFSGDVIADVYKKHHWMIPSIGLLARMANFDYNSRGRVYNQGLSRSYANENPTTEARTPIFANLLQRMYVAGVTTNLPFKVLAINSTQQHYMSSSQLNSVNVHKAQLQQGNTNYCSIGTANGGGAGNKGSKSFVRPVVIYNFTL